MSRFMFEGYGYDARSGEAFFSYSFEGEEYYFTERFELVRPAAAYDEELLDRALFFSFLLVGTSYYKSRPSQEVGFRGAGIDAWQTRFLDTVYQEGLSQFAYENELTRDDLAHFEPTESPDQPPKEYHGEGALLLQSGGKDSLLSALIMTEQGRAYDSVYVSASEAHPRIIDELPGETHVIRRRLDREGLAASMRQGGLNGHVPVTYIVESIGLVQAILLGKRELLVSIGHEGQEPHAWIEDLPVNHQWSKTWEAEQLFAQYVERYLSPDIRVGSLLRGMSELRIAELFVQKGWTRFGHRFSSCNQANYGQGQDNTTLGWCGTCPKCANSYLLFAPFVDPTELKALFGGRDLFAAEELRDTFKGLLGVGGVMKPFECVGEVAELRTAYWLAQDTGGYVPLPFAVPHSEYDYRRAYPTQPWVQSRVDDL